MSNPHSPTDQSESTPQRKLWVSMLQALGFLCSLGALVWAISVALKPENREQLSKLSQASVSELFMLMSLATISVAFNGLLFWVVIRPVHRLRATDVIATNAVSTLLAYLPFKLSIVSRFVIHNRRDKIPILTIGAWIVAVTFLILAVLGPISAASLIIQEVNAFWWIIALLGAMICTIIGSLIAKYFTGQLGAQRIAKIFGPKLGTSLTQSPAFARVHLGFEMLADLPSSLMGNLFRMLDLFSFALRFYVAAMVLDLPISGTDSLLLGASYFLIGLISPVGMLGTREAGTIQIASMIGISALAISENPDGQTPIIIAVLFVTAIESLVNLICAAFGIAWLRLRPGLPLEPVNESEPLLKEQA